MQFVITIGNWFTISAMDSAQLYNLEDDPGENRNLSQQNPQLLSEMKELYFQWNDQLEKPRWADDGHTGNTKSERAAASKLRTRQYPMPWISR